MELAQNLLKRILILGGTGEARDLAGLLVTKPGLVVISSLAGRTEMPQMPLGLVRSGGFGGISGLRDYLGQQNISAVIDATHPFASTITEHGIQACQAAQIPYLRLTRPAWQPEAEDHWLVAHSHTEAAQQIPGRGNRIFLTIGRQELHHYQAVPGWFLMRMIDPPAAGSEIPKGELRLERGPFALADELELLAAYRINLMVSKNSGGAATYSKIIAARQLQLPVIMIQRPGIPECEQVNTIHQAWDWLHDKLQHSLSGNE
ncbi:cobalt-precorrin-6A reductase [Synechococcus sp. PCC 6312]|uniref:cobalt-precorrin-6A reductase n=1 Tax=Synechococcus sp. (strain ATCC 27167 / PCC 6312) TaxID=195253 RepID=UPI00029F1CA4|nr:cobalt-precorrin-6A reductase [Synechococcus sp. PCC 6312]AFY60036.1 precorrin-6A reductase [Synechococcus sp. PCC 6312]